MQTIFGCSQGRPGIPALFPGFLLVHEKRRNNEEPVRRRLAKPWADGDVSSSAALSGCSQTGHALSRHGAATAGQPPHTSQSLPGRIQPPTKCQPSMKGRREGDLSLGTGLPAPSERRTLPGAAPAVLMAIVIGRRNAILRKGQEAQKEENKICFRFADVNQRSRIACSGRSTHQISTKARIR